MEETKQSSIIKKYSTIDYAVLKGLDVTPNELAYLDMIYYLSRAGTDWCYKSLQAVANDLNLGKSTIRNIRDRLIAKELLICNKHSYVKTTEAVHVSYGVRNPHDNNLEGDENRAKSAHYRAKSAHYRAKTARGRAKNERNRAKTTPKNNNRYTNRVTIKSKTGLAPNVSKDDEISKLYYEVIKALTLPVRNHATVKSTIVKIAREDSRENIVGYLTFMRDFYPQTEWDYKPHINEALDIHAKRVQIISTFKEAQRKTHAQRSAIID